jgi:hypothetical protein
MRYTHRIPHDIRADLSLAGWSGTLHDYHTAASPRRTACRNRKPIVALCVDLMPPLWRYRVQSASLAKVRGSWSVAWRRFRGCCGRGTRERSQTQLYAASHTGTTDYISRLQCMYRRAYTAYPLYVRSIQSSRPHLHISKRGRVPVTWGGCSVLRTSMLYSRVHV